MEAKSKSTSLKGVIACLIIIIVLLTAIAGILLFKGNCNVKCAKEEKTETTDKKDEQVEDNKKDETVAGEKVKVYIFEAGGCPYCKMQVEYLEGLDSYNKKFEIVMKELYVDHIEWAEGKDYALGKKVAEAFTTAGFTNASYYGTPFVVISDLYASTTYSESLESYINKAYEQGDKDIVSCLEKGNDCPITAK